MPRIRSVKPEIHSHRKTGPLSDRNFRVFLGLITQADDEGRFVADLAQLRAVIFAYHPRVRLDDVQAALEHLAGLGLIRLYQANGTRYGWLPSWADHQRIHKHHFTASKIPAPELSGASTGQARDTYGTGTAGSEGIGKEGIGTEGTGPPKPPSGAETDPLDWLDDLNREAGTHFKPSDSNLRPIRARIREGHTRHEAQLVIRAKVTEWRGTEFEKYLRPATLFGPKFDGYLQACGNGHQPVEDDEEL